MKFQVEFSEITKGLDSFDEELAIELTDKVCRGEIAREKAREELEKRS